MDLEGLLKFPVSHVYDRIFGFLDVSSKRRSLATSKTLRKFILDRSEKWEQEERLHNWLNTKRPCRIPLEKSQLRSSSTTVYFWVRRSHCR